jgi:FAD/FMN-containing dehydrogenase
MTTDFLTACRQLLGDSAVKTQAVDLEPFSVDWRKRYHGRPLAVVLPANTAEVAKVVELAGQHRVALVPQGGNTGLSGGATPDDSGEQVVLSLSRLRSVRARDADNKTLTVEAGVTLQQVQELAAEMGLFFPLSLGSEGSATIGGNLATNAGGTGVLRYGNARDLCLGVEVVTASGEIWNGLRGLRKDNTGYDLRDLFIGSEGTLGLITAAVVKLFPRPAGVMTALARVEGPASALRLLQIAQTHCDAALTGFEFMSPVSTQLVVQYFPDVARHGAQIISAAFATVANGAGSASASASVASIAGGAASDSAGSASVLLEISHPQSEAGATEMLEQVIAQALEEDVVSDAIVAQSVAQANALWHLRESITMAAAEDGPHIKHDIALPISGLVEFIAKMDDEILAAFPGLRLINFGHFGDGNLHYNIAPPASLGAGLAAPARRAAYADFLKEHEDNIRRHVHDRVVAMNGSISAEHGLGQLRRDEAQRYKSPVELQLMKTIKQALDPQGILNPGKVLPVDR